MKSQTKNYVALLTTTTLVVILACTQLTFAYFAFCPGGGTADTSRSNRDAARHESSNLSRGTIYYTYKDIATDTAKRENLDPVLFHAVINQESRWETDAVSNAGAYGLTQLMPRTAKGLGVNRKQPVENLAGGARYLKEQLDRYDGNIKLALYAYNTGPNNVARGRIGKETRRYATSIMGSLD